jgi:hypothetical protein
MFCSTTRAAISKVSVYIQTMSKLTDAELAAAKQNRRVAEASLACEGLYLSDEQKALFDGFEAEGLSHDERRKRITARYANAGAKVTAAE